VGKYEPLARYLDELPRDSWDASFEEIEGILNFELPPSAHRHDSWWGNSHRGNHSQAKGWIEAGWFVSDIDRAKKRVRLERGGGNKVTSELQELWRKARTISGIRDRTALEKAALTTFIQREAAKKLIALGGSDPNFEPAPRKRPFG
jgi:hypothetical protein